MRSSSWRAIRPLESAEAALAEAERAWDATLGAIQVQYARRFVRSDRQPLAALSGAELPDLGAQRPLSARRRVRIPRPAAGRAGAALCAARLVPRASAARRVAAVRRGRRAALVASAERPRHADALLGRSPVAAVRRRGVCLADRRRVACSTRSCRSSRRRRSSRGNREVYIPAAGLRAKRPRSSSTACAPSPTPMQVRRARIAADRVRRLERRHEPRRPRGPGRKRVARMVPRLRAQRVRACCAIARLRSDLAQRYRNEARWLTGMLELSWDGGWYRRAYFDDGTPLGSAQNEECKIDSLTQSWAVLSDAAQPRRAARAMEAVRAHLVRRDAQLVLLLTPPFDRMAHDPGYIKGYLPGIRENGGQYTHAALWTVIALARLGLGDEAMELFHMLNPINHTRTRRGRRALSGASRTSWRRTCTRIPMHVGRGGWTWYTGSAGWMYQAAIEGLLGLRRQGSTFSVEPVHPGDVADVPLDVDGRRHALPHHRRPTRSTGAAACGRRRSTACRWIHAPSRCGRTAAHTRCRSCSASRPRSKRRRPSPALPRATNPAGRGLREFARARSDQPPRTRHTETHSLRPEATAGKLDIGQGAMNCEPTR